MQTLRGNLPQGISKYTKPRIPKGHVRNTLCSQCHKLFRREDVIEDRCLWCHYDNSLITVHLPGQAEKAL